MNNHVNSFVEIQLSKGYKAIVDKIDEDLAEYYWEAHVGHTGRVYARRIASVDGKRHRIWMHRVVYSRAQGILFPVNLVDHIDNNPLNNRRNNLREVTHAENLRNAGKHKTSNLKGARYHKRDKRWSAAITINGKNKHLGNFDTAEEAHEAYCKAAKEYYGEFARGE